MQSEIQDAGKLHFSGGPTLPSIRKTGKSRLFMTEERKLLGVFRGNSIKEIIFPQTRAEKTLMAFSWLKNKSTINLWPEVYITTLQMLSSSASSSARILSVRLCFSPASSANGLNIPHNASPAVGLEKKKKILIKKKAGHVFPAYMCA